MKFTLPITLPKIKIPRGQAAFHLVAALLILFPLVFAPFLNNMFDLPKEAVLFLGMGLAAVLVLVAAIREEKLTLIRSPFNVAVIILPILAIISAWLSPNFTNSVITDPLLFSGAALTFFLTAHFANKEKTNSLIKILLLPGAILALLVLIQVAIVLLTMVIKSPVYIFNLFSLGFNPTGSLLSAVLLLAALLPLAIGLNFSQRTTAVRTMTALIALGFLSCIFALTKNPPVLLPNDAGWKIATGTMGTSTKAALLGFGPGNFIDAFTSFRPVELNSTPLWNLRFTAGSNFYFYLLSVLGIAGLAVILWLTVKILIITKNHLLTTDSPVEKGILASLLISLILFAFFPAPAVLIVNFFAVLGLLAAKIGQKQELTLAAGPAKFAPAAVAIIVVIFTGWHLSRFVLADYYFAQSLAAAAKNQGTQTYNDQIKAINLNPANDIYHLSYSQTNLALADSLAGQPNLTDQQKQAVVQLVQQSIREGRAAVTLAPNRAANWENLAAIYQGIINFAQGADQWSLTSLNQAIALDPTNPRIRLDLGGLYFAGKDYATAAQVFNQAISLKSDLANAHYNLAESLKSLNLKDQALKELQLTAGLVCSAGQKSGANTDCDKVNQEISDLNADLAKNTATPSATTTQGAALNPAAQPKLATQSAQDKNLQNTKITPPVKIATPSGNIQP
ncbi:tetratricopeptide repeat protein [Patescibacteria group bacterium]|nr:tetratricopeptide repeat protein [Patescibacteria group bacterium]